MTIFCNHCSRANSADARYCYFDGASLLGTASPAVAASTSFPTPFVFPSGHSCSDFDAFALGCLHHWGAAVQLLRQGFFQQFFNSIGRLDVAQLAQSSASFPDGERGLDQFLGRLPAKSLPVARLDVQPKLINLGTLKIGANSQLELTLENKGSGLIFGSIASNCNWLAAVLTPSGEQATPDEARVFQFRDCMTLSIHVRGQFLRASLKPLEADLYVDSNAGTFKLKVIASVPIRAFPEGCLAGARTPRKLAEKAKKSAKEAGVLFASGAVAAWYQANGWTYPVQGPTSNGMAAVQQFFEALGLSRPPKVYVSEPRLLLNGAPGAVLTREIQVRSDEHRPVFAHAVSSENWCVVKPALAQGNVVILPVEVTVPHEGKTTQAVLHVTSNGLQRFAIPVQVSIDAASTVAAASIMAPVAVSAATGAIAKTGDVLPTPKTKAKRTSELDKATPASLPSVPLPRAGLNSVKLLTHLSPLLVLGILLLGLVAKDIFSDAPNRNQAVVKDEGPEEAPNKLVKEADFKVAIQDEPDDGFVAPPMPRVTIEDEPEERFGKQPAAPVKVEIKDEPAEMGPDQPVGKGVAVDPKLRINYALGANKEWGMTDTRTGKRLTYSSTGSTNRSIVRVAGKSRGFMGGGQSLKLPDDLPRDARQRSSYSFNDPSSPSLRITQILEIVPSKQPVDIGGGQQRRLMDTMLVRYIFENNGKQPINAGFRQEIDTLIGGNDGVPFTVPGRGLVNSSADFVNAKQVPDFVQALETGDLRNPGTIVHISLKLGGSIEAPTRVVLCHWSSNGDLTNPTPTNMGRDSAIIMVWPDQPLTPGKRREMGYAYGLGSVTVADAGGTLAVSLDGNYDIGQSFTIIAYVNKPVAGQTVAIDLPPGLERIKGEQTQKVPAPNVGDTSIVAWEAKVLQTGIFPVKVKSSTGISQTKTITIARGEAPAGGKLALDLQGSFEPGQVFNVIGKVTDPGENQKLTLHLPAGLQKVMGDDTQLVPVPVGSKESLVQWQVRVVAPGKYAVRVSSSTGVAQTKTITIVQPTRSEGAFQILLSGDFAPGKMFAVSTRVTNPVPDQKLTLTLPDGLKRIEGDETQIPLADRPLAWKVKVEKAGKFTVAVKSTTGLMQRKTVSIEPPAEQGGRFDFTFEGEIRPGKEFRILAQVTKPAPNQSLKLVLPKGLELAKGEASQLVPAGNPGAMSALSWTVRVVDRGKMPIRIESSTGLARTKTITLDTPNSTLFGR